MNKAIIGRKAGMTQIFTPEGKVIPVTVIEAGPCPVVQIKTVEKDGYAALKLGFDEAKDEGELFAPIEPGSLCTGPTPWVSLSLCWFHLLMTPE